MLEKLISDALPHMPESPATMIHRIYQKVNDQVNADKDDMPDDVRDMLRDWLALSTIGKVCNMPFVKNRFGESNVGAFLVVALLNELDAAQRELVGLKANAVINGDN